MRITYTLEGMELQEGVNISSGIVFDYVKILRYDVSKRKAFLSVVVIPRNTPQYYSFCEEVYEKNTGLWEPVE